MFTGLIETVGHVSDIAAVPAGYGVRIRTALSRELTPGESVAVNGVCLTVTAAEGDEWQADIGPETARVTTLGLMKPGQPVNLERSLRAGDRFGGHFVQGHVDSVGTIEKGKLADFVLLDANPLDDIRHTQRIRAVVANGRYFPYDALRSMLAQAEATAAKR